MNQHFDQSSKVIPPIAPISEWPVELFKSAPKPIFARDYIRQRCKENGIDPAEIFGRSRKEVFVVPRQILMLEVRELYGKSFPDIARIFNRDHTTIIYGIRSAEKRRLPDGSFDLRTGWMKILADKERIARIRSDYLLGMKREKICRKHQLSDLNYTEIVSHLKWSRAPISRPHPPRERVYDVDGMKADYEAGKATWKIAKKFRCCPSRVARYRDEFGWTRPVDHEEKILKHEREERNQKIKALYEGGMSVPALAVRFQLSKRTLWGLARVNGWQKVER